VRCFVALSLPDPARAALSGLAGALAREWPGLSWTNSEGYHLTLAFLGEIDERGLACAGAALARLDEAAFPFRFSALGGFPPRGPWRVLYLGIDDAPAGAQPSPARRIYASFNEALAAEASERGLGRLNAEWGPAGGGRDFVPHITLARLPERRRGGRGAREGGIRGRGAREAGRRGEPTARGPTGRDFAEMRAYIASALAGQWTIDRCSLYKSELGRCGAVYTELERRLLRPAPA